MTQYAGDMVPPATTHGEPVYIRPVRRDMIAKIANNEKVGILNTSTWMMARSYAEKRALIQDLDGPDDLVIAWAGNRWTDFFCFQEDDEGRLWDSLVSALTPRRSIMLTEDEQEVVRAYRKGDLAPPKRITGKRVAKRKA